MADDKDISQLIDQAVSDALEAQLAELRTKLHAEIVDKVMQSVQPVLDKLAAEVQAASVPSAPAPGTGPTDLLNAAIASIYDANAQTEILKSLLDGMAQFTSRAVLLVVKGGTISAWQSRGFADQGAIKGFTLDSTAGLAGRAIRDREPVSAAAVDFDSSFIGTHGNPLDGNACVLPIVVREKVAAVIYTDAGLDGSSDQSALRLLVRSAASWLELMALRKAGGAAETLAPEPVMAAAAAASVPAPIPAAAPVAAPAPLVAPAPVEVQQPAPAPPVATVTPAAVPDASGVSAADEEVHKKAKRFAKLLVDEIKLYNQAKVTEGRQNKDLYKRLQEDIDKSRATYEKRYAATAAGSAGYFIAEVIRILADNDPSNLGSDFPQ